MKLCDCEHVWIQSSWKFDSTWLFLYNGLDFDGERISNNDVLNRFYLCVFKTICSRVNRSSFVFIIVTRIFHDNLRKEEFK